MDNTIGDWLNRVGIILNFLAGFLLAPELIGIERIKKYEKEIKTKINILENNFREIKKLQKTIFKNRFG